MIAQSLRTVPHWKVVVGSAMAGGLGWGIRGQYGHETGAMIAGLMVSLVLTFLLCPQGPSLATARAVAWCTLAIGVGGSMTYGQTIGLTHNPSMVGNGEALRWGLLGLAVKGGLWVGFAGAFLGMGLGGQRYGMRVVLGILIGLLALCTVGIRIFNEPFDPAHRILPKIYFSADWRWEPASVLKPRREIWGGYALAFAVLVSYLKWIRRDPLAPRLALWGCLGGVLGFPIGQSLQAFHAWNPHLFQQGFWARMDGVINWWNWMETTFGILLGACLGLGLSLNRDRIHFPEPSPSASASNLWEWILLVIHIPLLVACELLELPWAERVYDFGLCLTFLPILAVAGGRLWPWWTILPMTVLTIGGKTVRNLVVEEQALSLPAGILLYLVLPLTITTVLAQRLARAQSENSPAEIGLRTVLRLTVWMYFGLNFAFFKYPWPWQPWTTRTPNALFYLLAAVGITLLTCHQSVTRAEGKTQRHDAKVGNNTAT